MELHIPQAFASAKLAKVGAIAAGLALFGLTAQAQSTVYWDANGTSGVGGTGTWSQPGSAFWNTQSNGGGTLNTWTAGNYASFGGTAGTVTVSGTVNVGGVNSPAGLQFTSGGYTLSGGTVVYTGTQDMSALQVIDFSSGSGDVTIGSNIQLDYSIRPSGNGGIAAINSTANNLQLDGNFTYISNTGQARWVDLSQKNASGSITLNGSVSTTGTENPALRIGFFGGSLSTASYYINGDNSGLTNGNSADITRGIVYVGHEDALGTKTVRLGNSSTSSDTAQVLTNAAITVGNNISLSGDVNATRILGGGSAVDSTYSGNVSWGGLNNVNLQLTAVAGGRVTFSGNVTDGSATGSLQKIGAGTVVLTSNNNNFDLGVTVSEGTLLINNTSGSGTGAGTVAVESGATLGGTGYITTVVTANTAGSIFSPGDTDSIGELTMSGGLTANSGATFEYHINGVSVDSIDFGSAALTLDGDVTLNFTSLGTVNEGIAYSLFAGNGTWTGDDGAGLNFTFNGPTGYTLDSSYGSGNGYIWDAAGNSLTVQFAAVPEFSTTSMLMAGLAGLMALLFRRLKRAA